jgi:hypothetical protein
MAKRNVTLQLDEDVIAEAKVLAATRGTSISGLLTQQLRELVHDSSRYQRAKERALQAMAEAEGHGGVITWSREDLYDRWERNR